MKHTFYKFVLKHIIILLILSFFAVLFLFVMGQFMTLHPNAYRDLIRSILVVYIIYLFIYGFFLYAKNKNLLSHSFKSIADWWEKPELFYSIFEVFTYVTLVSSIMMVSGLDIPKQGVFAYIHMLSRLAIISLIMIIVMFKEVVRMSKSKDHCFNIKSFIRNTHTHPIKSISFVFTFITFLYCLIMIVFSKSIDPNGGFFFYQSLLVLLGVIVLCVSVLSIFQRKTTKIT